MSADEAQATTAPSWRDLAVSRSLDSARARAEGRVQRFLDAAVELMHEDGGRDFTVQEVVERSGQSLRSFYQYFDGKHELLLALFEESVRATAEHLRALVAEEDDALARLRRFAVEYYALCVPASKRRASKRGPTPAMAEFAQQLLTDHPHEAARAFAPVVSLFDELLEAAVDTGVVRSDVTRRRIAGVVLQAIMFHAFAATITAAPDARTAPAEELWDLLLHGIAAPQTA